jgi:hypothetical protein
MALGAPMQPPFREALVDDHTRLRIRSISRLEESPRIVRNGGVDRGDLGAMFVDGADTERDADLVVRVLRQGAADFARAVSRSLASRRMTICLALALSVPTWKVSPTSARSRRHRSKDDQNIQFSNSSPHCPKLGLGLFRISAIAIRFRKIRAPFSRALQYHGDAMIHDRADCVRDRRSS